MRSTSHCSDNRPLLGGTAFLPLKIVSKRKKQKKKKAILTRRTGGKPKGNGISPEGWQCNRLQLGEATFLTCHYAVSFWLGGAVAVRLTFATFLFFFWYKNTK